MNKGAWTPQTFAENVGDLVKVVPSHGEMKAQFEVMHRRHIRALGDVARGMGASAWFVMQPVPHWTERQMSAEESDLFEFTYEWATTEDARAEYEKLTQFGQWFRKITGTYCAEFDIGFYDLNDSWSRSELDGKWLYADTCHFNDLGADLCAEEIGREVLS